MSKNLSGIVSYSDGMGGDLSQGILTANEIVLNGSTLDPTINADVASLIQKTTNISYNSPVTEISNSLTVDSTLSTELQSLQAQISPIIIRN